MFYTYCGRWFGFYQYPPEIRPEYTRVRIHCIVAERHNSVERFYSVLREPIFCETSVCERIIWNIVNSTPGTNELFISKLKWNLELWAPMSNLIKSQSMWYFCIFNVMSHTSSWTVYCSDIFFDISDRILPWELSIHTYLTLSRDLQTYAAGLRVHRKVDDGKRNLRKYRGF